MSATVTSTTAPSYATSGSTPAVSGAPTRERLLALDVFRGATIAGMLLVNNPGTWGAIYPPLAHAAWNGWTPTDLIFPFFLFIVGITTHLSLTARRARGDSDRTLLHQVWRRAALIFLYGLFLSWFPGFTWGAVAGNADPSLLDRVVDRLYHVRIMGVLQRIAVCYLIIGVLTVTTGFRAQLAALGVMLLGYWAVMTLLPVPGTGLLGWQTLDDAPLTMAAWTDRLLLDWGTLGNHLYAAAKTWDPEGILSSVPAAGTALLGVFAGRWLGAPRPLADRLNGLFAVGALGMMVGLVWHWAFPINKSLWTSSYVVFTAGMAAVALATCLWLIDVRGWRGWTRPFVVYGVNPIVAFVGSGLMARMIYSILKVDFGGERISLQAAVYRSLFASWLPPEAASLGFALGFVLLWYVILLVLYKRNIFLKV